MDTEILNIVLQKYGVLGAIMLLLIFSVSILYKNIITLYNQTRQDSMTRELELRKCFEGVSQALKSIDATMQKTNERLIILEERSSHGKGSDYGNVRNVGNN